MPKQTLFHIIGESVEMDSVDARRTLQEHGAEWFSSEAAAKAAKPAPAPAPAEPSASDPVPPFEARDKGRGWWAVFDSTGKQMGGSIREEDGNSFNALSDEDKAAKVSEMLAEAAAKAG